MTNEDVLKRVIWLEAMLAGTLAHLYRLHADVNAVEAGEDLPEWLEMFQNERDSYWKRWGEHPDTFPPRTVQQTPSAALGSAPVSKPPENVVPFLRL